MRLYAEDPLRQFQPSPGVLTEVYFPEGPRVDGWVATGTEVPAYYDPMLAKLIVHGDTRETALARLSDALARTRLHGIATNLDYLRQIVADARFAAGELSTRFLETFEYRPAAIEVLEAGTYTSVQDYPGRAGYWDIGVPPSGPMDDYAFRLANRIVGNAPDAAGIEATLAGPTRFHGDAVIALTGAQCAATLDGVPVPMWRPVAVRAGQVLATGRALSGCRMYLAVRDGLDVPVYLGSRSTFALGQFGGHAGRTLRVGDMLPRVPRAAGRARRARGRTAGRAARAGAGLWRYLAHRRALRAAWCAGLLRRRPSTPSSPPTGKSTTTQSPGVRLTGPKPDWARESGGEAGLHPSNIHDCEYAIGSINFTGDSPVILTRDGPSLGGFVCPVTIAKAELWKVGQVKPGDHIRFVRMDYEQAVALEAAQDHSLRRLSAAAPAMPAAASIGAPARATASETIIAALPAEGTRPSVAYRQAGDGYLLLEYGDNVLDLALRMRIHLLMEALRERPVAGVRELSPGVRSLQIRYDSRLIRQDALIARLLEIEAGLADVATLKVPTRVVHLPLASRTAPRWARCDATRRPCAPARPGCRTTWTSSSASTAWPRATRCGASCTTPAIW